MQFRRDAPDALLLGVRLPLSASVRLFLTRSRRGRPRIRPLRLVGDKGYTGRRIRSYLRREGIRLIIPRLNNEPRRGPFNREIYRQRNLVERAINRIKQFQPIATRYEKLAGNYTAMLTLAELTEGIALILLWL